MTIGANESVIKQSKKGVQPMKEKEMVKASVEEFSRIQNYMILSANDSEAYNVMKQRYVELKVILEISGVDLTELDRIKE